VKPPLLRPWLTLLVVLIVLTVANPLLQFVVGGRFLFRVLVTIVFATAFVVVFDTRTERLTGLLLGTPTLIGMWSGYVLPMDRSSALTAALHLLAAVFLGFTMATILRKIYRHPTVSVEGICAAFCGYLLVGVAFAHIYCAAQSVASESFRGEEVARRFTDEEQRFFLLIYFSFVTLTTAGYGDIVPASDTTRALAVAETIIGQFYLAVLVAELIGKRVSQPVAQEQSDSTK
jgi:hypothetical protein